MSDGACEDRRQIVHLAMTGFALALRWLSPGQAAWCAGAAVALNWLVLPRLGLRLRREGGPFVDGIRMYPVAVLGLVLLLPLPLAAGAWGVLGVGDAASNLAGRRWGRPGFLGRSDRSLVGSVVFAATATPTATALMAYVSTDNGPWLVLGLCAALAGAVAEFTPRMGWLDDNLPIAAAAGGTLYLLAPTL